jgi:hypothetical protein
MRKTAFLAALVMLALAAPAVAQPLRNRTWTGQLAAGYSAPEGAADEFFQGGFTLLGGATWMPREGHFGVWMELGYTGLDVTNAALEGIGVADGDMRIWYATGGGIWSTRSTRKVNFYIAVGGGMYRRVIDLLNPTLEYVPEYCDPYWYFCDDDDYGGVVTTGDIVGENRETEVGYNGGFGMTFTLDNDSQIYVEIKYHSISTEIETEFLPFAVGYRW